MKIPFLGIALVSAALATAAFATPASVTLQNGTQVFASSVVSGSSHEITLQIPRVTTDTTFQLTVNKADGTTSTVDVTVQADGSVTVASGATVVSLADYLSTELGARLHLTVVNGKGFAAKANGSATSNGQGEVRSGLKGDNRASGKGDDTDGNDDSTEVGVSVTVSAGVTVGVGNGHKPELPKLGGKK